MHKIRYGGFLARAIKEEKLELARQSLGNEANISLAEDIDSEVNEVEKDDSGRCPKCHIGRMQPREIGSQFVNMGRFEYRAIVKNKMKIAINAP